MDKVRHGRHVRAIPNAPEYKVTSDGRVLGKFGRFLRQQLSRGYPAVTLQISNVPRKVAVHRLVLEAWVGPPKPEQQCRHINGDPTDNRLENLCWGTSQENADDRLRHGTVASKLTKEQVLEIRGHLATGEYSYLLAKAYGVSYALISAIKHRRIWRHV